VRRHIRPAARREIEGNLITARASRRNALQCCYCYRPEHSETLTTSSWCGILR